jgi:hypothetical protein
MLFTEIFWRTDKVILNQYWRVLPVDIEFEEVSNKYYFSNTVCSHLNRWEDGKCNGSSGGTSLESKTRRDSYFDLKLLIFFIKLNSFS